MAGISHPHANVLGYSFIGDFWSHVPVSLTEFKIVFGKDCLGFVEAHLRFSQLARLGRGLYRARLDPVLFGGRNILDGVIHFDLGRLHE